MADEGIFVLMFLTGLTGGFGHCLGMCGPVVAAYSVALPRNSTLPHILYNLGRITTYSILGAAMGLTGSFLSVAAGIQGLQKWAMVFAGAVIVVMGIGMAGVLPFLKRLENRVRLLPYLNRVRDIFSEGLSTGAFYPMGVLLGFIPCGLVYTALLAAARVGMEAPSHLEGLLRGLLVMLLFGLGTLPSLLLFGKVVNVIGTRLRSRLYLVSSAVMIIAGLVFILRALRA
jgi:sulfite exporter TauE/SafE